VVRERLTMMAQESSLTIDLNSQRFQEEPYHSFTILRAKFDQWLAEKAAEKGAFLICKNRVDQLVMEGGKVLGIRAPEAEIQAQVVVAADGALSFLAEKAGLRGRYEPSHFAVGIKEVIELPRETIQERFNLEGNQGVAQLFFGALTKGMFGGGFLYTNLESLSLGLVVGIDAFLEGETEGEIYQLLDGFKARPEIEPLLRGGESAEYSARIVPEGGLEGVPQLVGEGIILVGDAAGLALNTGMVVRGMDYALASGSLAAQAIIRAREKGDFSLSSLSYYQELLRDSFVLKDLETFKHMPHFLHNPRLFGLYPEAFCGLLEELMWIPEGPKEKISTTIWREVKGLLRSSTWRDIWELRKV
jgi:electron transfer flavoprotein-quinone oxidoreductase